jgi:hypothetical protein
VFPEPSLLSNLQDRKLIDVILEILKEVCNTCSYGCRPSFVLPSYYSHFT